MWRSLLIASISLNLGRPSASAAQVNAKIPGQEVEIHLSIDGFEAKPGLVANERTLLGGALPSGAILSVLVEENMPFLSGRDCRERYKEATGYEAFMAGDIAACRYRVEGAPIVVTHYYAWLTTSDYLFIVHASTTSMAKGAAKVGVFDKAAFQAIVATCRVTGRADRGGWLLPPEVYAFRDEASAHGEDQIAWVEKQCESRLDEFGPQYYLGALASQRDDFARAIRGSARAAEILVAKPGRTPQENQVLFESLDTQARMNAQQKKYREALEPCGRLADVCSKTEHPRAAAFRQQALYNMAVCQAQTSRAIDAIDSLRKAIALQPEFKARAKDDELLKPLRGKKEFKALVGG